MRHLLIATAALLGAKAALACCGGLIGPCTIAVENHMSCDATAVTAAKAPTSSKSTAIAGFTGGANGLSWGTTRLQVNQYFPYFMEQNFIQNANANAMVTAMSADMLARLSTELHQQDTSGAYTPLMLKAAAGKLSAANLRRLQGAFGPTLLTAAIAYAPAAVQSAYRGLAVAPPLYLSQYWYTTQAKVAPTYSAGWAYELVLDRYTSTLESQASSIQHAVVHAQAKIQATWLEVIGAAAAAATIVEFFDSNAWHDIKAWAQQQIQNLPPITNPYPIVITPYPPPGGGYPGGFPPEEDPPISLGEEDYGGESITPSDLYY